MKIGGAYLEDFNLYSCRRDLATMFRDTYMTYMKRFSGFHSSDFHWSLGALPCETTFQTFIEIFYDLLETLFKKMCEENYIVDGDLLRLDYSIKTALRIIVKPYKSCDVMNVNCRRNQWRKLIII